MHRNPDPPEHADEPRDPPMSGRDEMNLAEFPFATLRARADRQRKSIRYEGWITREDGTRQHQTWIVRGLEGEGLGTEGVGLPTEFDERVYVALMYLTAEAGFASRKVPFSMYQVLRVMGLATSGTNYRQTERALDRLKGITIRTEGAFWDNERHERVRTLLAFNLIDEYWLSYRESDQRVIEAEGVPAYILWSERIWASIRSGYIKALDVTFFYSLSSPVSRRLYRFLDKRMQYQTAYEIDVFDLASRLGMTRYRYPSKVIEKLQPGFDELVARGFLVRAEPVKRGRYTRIAFTRTEGGPGEAAPAVREPDAPEEPAPAETLLVGAGLGMEVARRLARDHTADHIQEKLAYLEHALESDAGAIRNPRGWLRRAIEEDYGPPDGYHVPGEDGEEGAGDILDEPEGLALPLARVAPRSWTQWVSEARDLPEELCELSEQLRADLRLQLPVATYDRWVRALQVTASTAGRVTIALPSQQAYEWLAYRLKPQVERTLVYLTGRPVQVSFEVLERPEGREG